jgi:cytochrome c oxidase subunit I+III
MDCREVLITSVVDAAPRNKYEFPRPTIWPFIAAVLTSATFVGSVFTAWALPLGAIPTGIALILWFWPTAPGHHIGEPTSEQASPAEEAS